MFPWNRKPIVQVEPVVQVVVDHKAQTLAAIKSSKDKVGKIEQTINAEVANRTAFYEEYDALQKRAIDLQTAIEHGNKMLDIAGENATLRNHLTVAERELEQNIFDSNRVMSDIKRTTKFLNSTSEKVDTIKERIADLESDLSSLSLRELESSIESELHDTDLSIRNFREEVFTKEALSTLR